MSAKVSRRPRLTTQPQAKREDWLDVLDWRVTPANSAKSRDVSLNQWAWEFLRRNTEYQKVWGGYAELLTKIAADDPALKLVVAYLITPSAEGRKAIEQLKAEGSLIEQFLSKDELTHYEPHRESGESSSQWLRRVKEGTQKRLRDVLGERWGLKRIANPNWEFDPMLIEWNGLGVREPTQYSDLWVGDGSYPATKVPWMVFAFDMRLPLPLLKQLAIGAVTVGQDRAAKNRRVRVFDAGSPRVREFA